MRVASSGTVVAGVSLHAWHCGCVVACVLLRVCHCMRVVTCGLPCCVGMHVAAFWHAWCSAFSSMSMICSLPYIQGYELHH